MTTLDSELIGQQLPNLDGEYSIADLEAIRVDLKTLAEACNNLASYAEAKASAMELRTKGKIADAQRFESAAETVYRRLPEWAKW